MKASGLGAF